MTKLMIVLCAVFFGSVTCDSYDPMIQILNDDPEGHDRIKQGLLASANKFKEEYTKYMEPLLNTFTENIFTDSLRAGSTNIQECLSCASYLFKFVKIKVDNSHSCIDDIKDAVIKRLVNLLQERAQQSGTTSVNIKLLSGNKGSNEQYAYGIKSPIENDENKTKRLESFLKSFETSLAPCMDDMSTVHCQVFTEAVYILRFINSCIDRLLTPCS